MDYQFTQHQQLSLFPRWVRSAVGKSPFVRRAASSFVYFCVWIISGTACAEDLALRFRDDPQVSSPVVRLRDLVEVVSSNSPMLEKMLETPLGPAPRDGSSQNWHSSDVLQHLELRGFPQTGIRWMGRDHVLLLGSAEASSNPVANLTPAFIDQRIIDIASANTTQAIVEYLNLQSRSRTDWRVALSIPADQARLLQSKSNIAAIGGGHEPWTGDQTFTLQVKTQGEMISIPVGATVNQPPMVVVAASPLRKDQLLTSDMLTYAPLPRNAEQDHYFTEVDSLLGKQLRRSVSTRQAISQELLGDPIVIQRNEMVEVESVAGSIVVRTTAKSLAAGAVGDLVDVEMPNRRRLMATVVGPAQVRINAVSMPSLPR